MDFPGDWGARERNLPIADQCAIEYITQTGYRNIKVMSLEISGCGSSKTARLVPLANT